MRSRDAREASQRGDELVQFVCAIVDCAPNFLIGNAPLKLTDGLNYFSGFLQRLRVISVVGTAALGGFNKCETEIQVSVEEID